MPLAAGKLGVFVSTFQRSLPTVGTDQFVAVLTEELQGLGLALPLEKGCLSGGFPTAVRVTDVAVLEMTEPEIRARFTATFTERAQPGCGGGPAAEHHRQIQCLLTIDRRTAVGHITVAEPDLPDEF